MAGVSGALWELRRVDHTLLIKKRFPLENQWDHDYIIKADAENSHGGLEPPTTLYKRETLSTELMRYKYNNTLQR